MTELDYLAKELFAQYGNVKRARGPFLYTEKGVRLVDMYQENGRAILGWGGGSAFTVLKNSLSKGATGSFITANVPRLQKAVSVLLDSKRKVYVFSSKKNAIEAAINVCNTGVSFYRPWDAFSKEWSAVPVVILEPPFPWVSGIYILSVLDTLENEVRLSEIEGNFEISRLSDPVLAGVVRSIYNLKAALTEREEKDWFIYDTVLSKYWLRKGPYLYPKDCLKKDSYRQFVKHCLNCAVVVSPFYEVPSIVPFGADRGVFKKLAKEAF